VQSPSDRFVVLATGGTIAGRAGHAQDNVGYRAAELGVDELLKGLVPAGLVIEGEQVAQLDSKDMDHATWQRLVRRCAGQLARPEVRGVVVTHGTDTLEETAWLLHRVLAPAKPLVLTAAMRPATSLQADGPQNLVDALTVAASDGAAGVLVVLAGSVHGAAEVRKQHSYRLDAFSSGDAGPIASLVEGRLRRWRDWPAAVPLGPGLLDADPQSWPWVEIVISHAGARAAAVDALVGAGVRGLVVAGTGNGTVHQTLAAALVRAQAAGVAVRVVTRCAAGPALAPPGSAWSVYPGLSPSQARAELMLELMLERRALPR
jgi:L-asparaginase